MMNYSDTRDTFRNELPDADLSWSDEAEALHVTVSEGDVGHLYRVLRQNDFEYRSKRIGSAVVAAIETTPPNSLQRLVA